MKGVKLICGDSFNKLESMPDNFVDVSFTSPPYNRKRNDKYLLYNDTVADYLGMIVEATNLMLKKTKKYVFVNVQANYYNKVDVYKYIGLFSEKIQQIIIWEKSNPNPANNNSITNAYEFIIVLGDVPLKTNYSYTKNHITTSVNSDTTLKIHKAVMKQEVSNWIIDCFTKPNDIVLDMFMGTGTTGVSCVKYGRRFIGVELIEKYFDIAKGRIENEQLL